jgi:hypothetical protein
MPEHMEPVIRVSVDKEPVLEQRMHVALPDVRLKHLRPLPYVGSRSCAYLSRCFRCNKGRCCIV